MFIKLSKFKATTFMLLYLSRVHFVNEIEINILFWQEQ